MASMDLDEYLDWQAYERLSPWGEDRDDLRMGIGTAALMNMQIPRGQQRVKAADLMPKFDDQYIEKEPVDPALIQAMFINRVGGVVNGG